MNSIVQNPTPMDSEGFFLCGGTLTTLLLRARKTQGENKPKEMFSEPETFAALVEAIAGFKWSPEMRTLQGMTSNYRNCSASVSSIPLEDASIAAQYDTAVQYDFSTINKRMEDFVTDHLDPFRASIFVKSVIELIRDDSSIPLGQFFFMNGSDRPTTKHQLEVQCEVAIAPFLVGIWHFILMNRRGKNALGLSTLNKWGPKVKSRPRDLSQYPFGASILHDIVKVAVVRPPFLIDFPRCAHTRDEFGHEKSQPVFLPTGCHANMRLCVSPQILYDNDCFGRSVKPAVTVRQSFFLQP